MKPHVTLVNPPYPSNAHQHPPFTPLGLGYLAAVLEKNNFEVDVIDCQALGISYGDFKSELGKRKPDVVGMTSTTLTYKSALKIAEITKQIHPNCLTVLGGVQVTFWEENALKECPSLDLVARKEGENTILELVQRIEAGKSFNDILGITFRDGNGYIRNPDRPYIEDLDSLPFPAHHLWPLDRLKKYGDVMFPLMTSRGCVYWCEFCSAVRMFGRRYRMRSAKNVVDEMEHLHKTYGSSTFTFYDDAFTVDQARVEEICEELHDRNLKLTWDCGTRVDMVNKEARKIIDRGADTLVPSGNPLNMFLIENDINEVDGAPIIDAFGCAVKMSEFMVDLKNIGITRSKHGLHTAPPKEVLESLQRLFGAWTGI